MHARTIPAFLLAAALAALASSCSNGGTTGNGEVSFVLTDSASDELTSFEVDVSNLVLTRLDGTTVSVMPAATRVDFTDLVSVGELVAAHTLEAGLYKTLTL